MCCFGFDSQCHGSIMRTRAPTNSVRIKVIFPECHCHICECHVLLRPRSMVRIAWIAFKTKAFLMSTSCTSTHSENSWMIMVASLGTCWQCGDLWSYPVSAAENSQHALNESSVLGLENSPAAWRPELRSAVLTTKRHKPSPIAVCFRFVQSGFIPVSVDDGHLLTESGHLIRLRNKTFLVPLDYLQQLTSSGIYLLVLDSLTFHLVQFYAR